MAVVVLVGVNKKMVGKKKCDEDTQNISVEQSTNAISDDFTPTIEQRCPEHCSGLHNGQ